MLPCFPHVSFVSSCFILFLYSAREKVCGGWGESLREAPNGPEARLGSLEVQLAFVTKDRDGERLVLETVFSKLGSQSWPNATKVAEKVGEPPPIHTLSLVHSQVYSSTFRSFSKQYINPFAFSFLFFFNTDDLNQISFFLFHKHTLFTPHIFSSSLLPPPPLPPPTPPKRWLRC